MTLEGHMPIVRYCS